MSAKSTTTCYCSNQLGRIILQGMEEIMGQGGANAVFNMARLSPFSAQVHPNHPEFNIPFQHISRLQQTFERKFGPRSGQGLALRIGRATFYYGFREFGEQAGMNQLNYRLLPPREKIQVGASKLAEWISKLTDQSIRIEEQDETLRWIVEGCPYCFGRHADAPVCHMEVGFLQEFLYWASGGKYFNVVETECIAMGAPACVYTISKQAFD